MPLTKVTKDSTSDVGWDPDFTSDIPSKEKLLKFSKFSKYLLLANTAI